MEVVFKIFNHIASGGFVMLLIALDSFFLWYLVFKKLLFLWKKDITVGDGVVWARKGEFPGSECGIKALFLKGFLEGKPPMEVYKGLSRKLREDLFVIEVLSVCAPLLGLLGTVIGMVKVFSAIMMFGAGNLRAIASGISEALITTQGGLVVAIPGVYAVNFLKKRVKEKENELKGFMLALGRLK